MYSRDNSDTNNVKWCIDSGCTGHMCNDRNMFKNFTRLDSELNLANDQSIIDIEKVFYVSDLRTNLLSVSKITDRGFEVTLKKKDAIVLDKNRDVLVRADRVGNLYYVRKSPNTARNAEIKMAEKKSIDEWHEKLGHLNEYNLKQMAKSGRVYSLNIKGDEKLTQCEVCLREKQTSTPFPKSTDQRTVNLLEIVHTNLCGPMRHSSFSGKKYFVTFIDDKSRWCEVYFVNNKSEILDLFKQYKAEVENLTGNRIKILQSDNGKEYIHREFDAYLKTQGTKRRLTVS